jgi:hypothetical protein
VVASVLSGTETHQPKEFDDSALGSRDFLKVEEQNLRSLASTKEGLPQDTLGDKENLQRREKAET